MKKDLRVVTGAVRKNRQESDFISVKSFVINWGLESPLRLRKEKAVW